MTRRRRNVWSTPQLQRTAVFEKEFGEGVFALWRENSVQTSGQMKQASLLQVQQHPLLVMSMCSNLDVCSVDVKDAYLKVPQQEVMYVMVPEWT